MAETEIDTTQSEAAEARAIAKAEADVAAGRLVPHDLVVRWLRSWGKPDEEASPAGDGE